ncbi:MAG: MBL fold metallo-hydrolase [Chitinophagaceae bacterium]|nr:MBL fold metallo-hydrolase [Chitinophagaceae bacterium]
MKKLRLIAALVLVAGYAQAQYGAADSAVIVRPFKIFDNLYYVGNSFVSAYLLRTDKGLVLIDALYGKDTAYTPAAARQLGFRDKDIRYILCTHGHYDHCEGAGFVQRMTGARIGMTAPDWDMAEGKIKAPYTSVNNKLTRDRVIRDGDSLQMGNTTIYFFETPGHTPGVLSMRFPVRDGNKTYTAFMFGGVGLNFDGVERTEMYLRSVDRIQKMAGIEVNISNHPGPGKIFERARQLANRKPGDPHPFVDAAAFQSWLNELKQGAEQKLAEEKKKAGSPH